MKLFSPLVGIGAVLGLLVNSPAQAQTERVCQTPDCLQVENLHSKNGLVKSIGILDTRMHLYIYAPSGTKSFSLGVFDQSDDSANSKPSEFALYAPDGTLSRSLDSAVKGNWANYPIETGDQWGVWRLSVTGPQDVEAVKGQKTEKAINAFMVRTVGEVDLYLKPDAVARVRGLRLTQPQFGGSAAHNFTVQSLDEKRLCFNVLRGDAAEASKLGIKADGAKEQRFALDKDDRLRSGLTLETIEYSGLKSGLNWPLAVENIKGTYGLGVEQESRVFFNASPLMKLRRVGIKTVDENGQGVAARVEVTSPRTANESTAIYTDANGDGAYYALDGVSYPITVSRGHEYQPFKARFASAVKLITIPLKRQWPHLAGWYGGDSHCHTCYYDGTNTPAQMVEAARGAGLYWVVVSEHGHSERIERAERANAEALALNEPGKFTVIPGMEYTGPTFHANILGALVHVKSGATLAELLEATKRADSPANPVVCKLNHPSLGKTAAQIGRETPGLSLMELWNSEEPEATDLWFEMLNRGQRVWAETASDSHNRQTLELGSRRTYVYLGAEKPDAASIVRALREGRSFLSRGAALEFTVDGARSGATLKTTGAKLFKIRVEARSAKPMMAVEIVANGKVVQRFATNGGNSFEREIELPLEKGWVLARVIENEKALPLALVNPIWIEKE